MLDEHIITLFIDMSHFHKTIVSVLILFILNLLTIHCHNISALISFINCVNTTGNHYNYTISSDGYLIILPSQHRLINTSTTNKALHDCQAENSEYIAIAIPSSLYSDEDTQCSSGIDAFTVNNAIFRGLRDSRTSIPYDNLLVGGGQLYNEVYDAFPGDHTSIC
jgi:hypothetical protein